MVKHPRLVVFFIFTLFFTGAVCATGQDTGMAIKDPGYAISAKELEISLDDIKGLVEQGSWLEAKKRYQTLLRYDLAPEDRARLRSEFEALNLKLLFSPIETENSFIYSVKSGDSLYKIAKKHHTTIELLKKSNYLSDDLIRPGMKLKISKSIYSIRVDKSENKLYLMADGEIFKTYQVATGRGELTPMGKFTIKTKLENPVWYKAGAVYPPDSPKNILGTRWLGFSLSGYGIHGTTKPETIGTHATDGCVRMYNREVEELYAIVPLNTKVTITE